MARPEPRVGLQDKPPYPQEEHSEGGPVATAEGLTLPGPQSAPASKPRLGHSQTMSAKEVTENSILSAGGKAHNTLPSSQGCGRSPGRSRTGQQQRRVNLKQLRPSPTTPCPLPCLCLEGRNSYAALRTQPSRPSPSPGPSLHLPRVPCPGLSGPLTPPQLPSPSSASCTPPPGVMGPCSVSQFPMPMAFASTFHVLSHVPGLLHVPALTACWPVVSGP